MPTAPDILPAQTYTPATIDRAAALLAAGHLVILPTETVYGIAVNLASPDARSRAKSLKRLPDRPGWVLHLATADDASRLLPDLSPFTTRILARAWPGPVAFQLRLTPAQKAALESTLGPDVAAECLTDSFLTLRCPDLPATTEILARASAPIAILSASGPSGDAPYELSDIPEPIRSAVDALVDAGPTRYRKPSTLVRVSSVQFPVSSSNNPAPSSTGHWPLDTGHSSPTGHWTLETGNLRVLRPGVIDERIIHRMADRLILFVCSGNTCRSPMAAIIAQKILAERLGVPISELPAHHVIVQSAGLHAMGGMRATREAVNAVRDRNLDLNAHTSQPATLDLLRRADVVFTMTDAHREEILEMLPGAAHKVHRLDPEGDVDDPIGSDESVYRQVADHLEDIIRQRISELVP